MQIPKLKIGNILKLKLSNYITFHCPFCHVYYLQWTRGWFVKKCSNLFVTLWSFKVQWDKHVSQIRKLKIGNIYKFILGNYITFYSPFSHVYYVQWTRDWFVKKCSNLLVRHWKFELFISLFWVIISLSMALLVISVTSYSCNGLEAGLLKNKQAYFVHSVEHVLQMRKLKIGNIYKFMLVN